MSSDMSTESDPIPAQQQQQQQRVQPQDPIVAAPSTSRGPLSAEGGWKSPWSMAASQSPQCRRRPTVDLYRVSGSADVPGGASAFAALDLSAEAGGSNDIEEGHGKVDVDNEGSGSDCSYDDDDDDDDNDDGDGEGVIVPIGQEHVGRIVAGQAVSDLASAVKELVDNALDAGASSIVIRLVNQGLDAVEVSDDGGGVPRDSRPLLAMKHATSKIRSFDDLYKDTASGQSLGFRGEALFCLANLSGNLVVTTRVEGEEVGQRLEFGREGYVRDGTTSPVHRKVGTTVTVHRLFEALPVRRVDLERRIKAQRARLMKLMQGYGVLCLGTSFSLVDVAGEGQGKGGAGGKARSKQQDGIRLQTSDRSVRFEETVSSVLGSKFLSGLSRTGVDLTDAVKLSETKRKSQSAIGEDEDDDDDVDTTVPGIWRVEGLVSKAPAATGGAGRTSGVARALQFFSINGRPVQLSRISNLLGDAWRQFDAVAAAKGDAAAAARRRPACVLQFFLPNNMYDVNLSPDKREVLLNEEAKVCELIRVALIRLWTEQSEGTFVLNEVETMSNSAGRRRVEAEVGGLVPPAAPATNASTEPPTVSSEASSSRSRMERRNAFVHRFENIGKLAPDTHPNLPSVLAEGTRQASGPDSTDGGVPLVATASRSEKSICARTPESLRPSSDVSNTDRSNWEQTRLQFNEEGSGQQDDISALASISTAKAADSASSDDELETLRKRSKTGRVSARAKKRTKRISAANRLKQFAFGAEEGKDCSDESEEGGKVNAVEKDGIDEDGEEENDDDDDDDDDDDGDNDDNDDENKKKNYRQTPKAASQEVRLGVDGHDNRDFTKAIGHSPNVQEFKRNRVSMRRNSIVKTLNVADSIKDPDGGDTEMDIVAQNAAMRGNQENQKGQTSLQPEPEEIDDGGADAAAGQANERESKVGLVEPKLAETDAMDIDTSPSQARDQEKPKRPPAEKVIWENFAGTSSVVRQARIARIGIESNRKAMNENKRERGGADNLDSSKPGERTDESFEDGDDAKRPAKRAKVANGKGGKIVNLTKSEFPHMSIIGQFNLGFILARCRDNHLWILDQHGCDEKRNFERLCNTTEIHEQKLIAPLPLELSPSEEDCVLENMETFEKNGFRFAYDSERPPRHRLSLTALPYSGSGGDGHKAVQFGKEDVGALCSVLGADGASSSGGYVAGSGTGADGSGQSGNNAVRRYAGGANATSIVRLPKAIAMFASRACRGSIMIGDALSDKEMKVVVTKMIDCAQPWDCAHGRPTVRHVTDIEGTLLSDEREAARHIAGPGLVALTQTDEDETH